MSLQRDNFGLYPNDHVSWIETYVPGDFVFSGDVIEISERCLIPAFEAMREHFIESDDGRTDGMWPVRATLPTALHQAEALAHLAPPAAAPPHSAAPE